MDNNQPASPACVQYHWIESIALTDIKYFPKGPTPAFYTRDLVITTKHCVQTIGLFSYTSAAALEIVFMPAADKPA